MKELGDSTDMDALVFEEGFFASLGEANIDLALIVGIDSAADQRPLPRFQRADDPGHLRGQYAQKTLNVADDHGAAVLENCQGEVFNFLEIPGSTSVPGTHQTQMRDDLEKLLGHLFQPLRELLLWRAGTGGEHINSTLPAPPHAAVGAAGLGNRAAGARFKRCFSSIKGC